MVTRTQETSIMNTPAKNLSSILALTALITSGCPDETFDDDDYPVWAFDPADFERPPPPETVTCDITQVPDFIDPKQLEELLWMVWILSNNDKDELQRVCTLIRETFVEPIEHSTGADYPPDVEKEWATLVAKYWQRYDVEVRGHEPPQEDEDDAAPPSIDAAYPCGEGPHGLTLCTDPDPFPEGPTFMLAMLAETQIPLHDMTHGHQYAFVFDADGDPSNNYMPSPSYPYDFFADTDLWYTASYTPVEGWGMFVTTVRDGQFDAMPSRARLVIADNTVMALIPAEELGGQMCPPHRMTAFTHLGDWGLEPPHVWNGDTEPPVHMGLQGTCD
jgi:hypothetical protein